MAEQTIDLNTADAEELTSLPGIGPVLAQRIVSYRQTVGPFEEAADIMAVSGIGEKSYGAVADRLTATEPVEKAPPVTGEGSAGKEEGAVPEGQAAGEETGPDTVSVGEEAEAEQIGGAAEAVPSGEPVPGEDFPPEHGLEVREREAVGEAVGGSNEEEASRPDPSPSPLSADQDLAGSSRERRGLSWLWIALVGGLLGMVFALIAFAGINGSLDVGHSRAVLGVEANVDALARDLDALSADVEGLGRRIEALEELATRMDEVELSVDELRGEMSDLGAQTDALEGEVDGLGRELEGVAEDVADLQQEAEQTRSFFNGLQGLLDDVFGATEAESSPTATPEGK